MSEGAAMGEGFRARTVVRTLTAKRWRDLSAALMARRFFALNKGRAELAEKLANAALHVKATVGNQFGWVELPVELAADDLPMICEALRAQARSVSGCGVRSMGDELEQIAEVIGDE